MNPLFPCGPVLSRLSEVHFAHHSCLIPERTLRLQATNMAVCPSRTQAFITPRLYEVTRNRSSPVSAAHSCPPEREDLVLGCFDADSLLPHLSLQRALPTRSGVDSKLYTRTRGHGGNQNLSSGEFRNSKPTFWYLVLCLGLCSLGMNAGSILPLQIAGRHHRAPFRGMPLIWHLPQPSRGSGGFGKPVHPR